MPQTFFTGKWGTIRNRNLHFSQPDRSFRKPHTWTINTQMCFKTHFFTCINLFLSFDDVILNAMTWEDQVLMQTPSEQLEGCPPSYAMHSRLSRLPGQDLLFHVFLALTGTREDAMLSVAIIMHPTVPFLWCNRVGGKTLKTAVVGGQLSGRLFEKNPFAVYTSWPTVQKAINTWSLIFHY